MPRPERGRIIEATALDPQGRNSKKRPLLIVTKTEDIQPGKTFLAVAITGTFPLPLPDDHIRLPWHRQGNTQTQLRKESVAVCSWYVEITEADILGYRGTVPAVEMYAILKKLASLGAIPLESGSDSSPLTS